MKKRIKSILWFFLSMTIVITLLSSQAFAYSDNAQNLTDKQLASLKSFNVSASDIEKVTPLYHSDETVIAYCVEGKNSFTIIDLNGMVIVQNMSCNSPFYDMDTRVYIKGPMDFYVKNGRSFTNVMDNKEVVTSEDFSDNIIVSVQRSLRGSETESSNVKAINTKYLPYTPRSYFYNPTGICMGTAGATLLAYYKDHINSNIASSRHINSDGVGLTILLAEGSYYRYTTGSAASRAAQVLNWYMTTHGTTTYTASYTSTNIFSTVMTKINANRPLQAHFNNTSINHSVMVRGYRQDTSNSANNGIYCTYGWNSDYMNVFVNANYIYGLIWINA